MRWWEAVISLLLWGAGSFYGGYLISQRREMRNMDKTLNVVRYIVLETARDEILKRRWRTSATENYKAGMEFAAIIILDEMRKVKNLITEEHDETRKNMDTADTPDST